MNSEFCGAADILVHYLSGHCSRIAIQIIDPDDSWSPSSANAISCDSEHSVDETEMLTEHSGGHSRKGYRASPFSNFLPLTRRMTDQLSVLTIVKAALLSTLQN